MYSCRHATGTAADYKHIGLDGLRISKGKSKNKKEICDQFGLDIEKPLFVFIGRLVGEKAADLLPDSISSSIYQHHANCNFLVLGSGEPAVESDLESLKHQFSGYVNTYIGYSESLSHLLYAGADFLLMPSRVEPCGLNQMYSLKYGSVPIVRAAGGLDDTIDNFDRTALRGNGFKFSEYDAERLLETIHEALLVYSKRDLWRALMLNGMRADYSWSRSARQYVELYQGLVGLGASATV